MSCADQFKICFDRSFLSDSISIFSHRISEKIISPSEIVIDFVDGSTFRYFI
jgi:hypothetical protein